MIAHPLEVPLIPDGEQGREWAERELSDPVYDLAEPTVFDRAARAIADVIAALFSGEAAGDWGGVLAVLAAVVVAVIIAAAFLVWGMPRSTRRAAAASPSLFDGTEARSAAELRREAEAHARREEWDAAIVLRFRALARSTIERGVVEISPGDTVHAFAARAGRVFPASADDLERGAAAFDDVRYLRRPGTAELYDRIAQVDDAVARARPASAPVLAGAGA